MALRTRDGPVRTFVVVVEFLRKQRNLSFEGRSRTAHVQRAVYDGSFTADEDAAAVRQRLSRRPALGCWRLAEAKPGQLHGRTFSTSGESVLNGRHARPHLARIVLRIRLGFDRL